MRKFALTFSLVLFAFGLANVVSYFVRTDGSGAADAIRRAGFPFLVWEEGGLSHRHSFSQLALWGDIAVAIGAGVVVGKMMSKSTRR